MGAEARKVRGRDKFGSFPRYRARRVVMTHDRMMFGTESVDFRNHDSRCWDSAGGFSGTTLADWIETSGDAADHRDGRRRLVAER